MQDKQLIEKYSLIIAEFMGYEKASKEFQIKWCCSNNEEAFDRLYQKTPELVPLMIKENKEPLFIDSFRYHKDWNEIHKLKFKVINDNRFDFTDEKCLYYKGLINHCLLYKEEPFEAFMVIGKCIEYLNTIKN